MPRYQQIKKTKIPVSSTFQKHSTFVSQTPASNPYSIIQRARVNPKSLTHADIMQLQRTIGNRAVGRLLSGIGNPSTDQQATVQRQEIPEEEQSLQGKMIGTVQRQEIPEEEESLQGKFENKPELSCPSCFSAPIVQRQELEDEEKPLQGKMTETIQRQEIPEEEEPLQGKMIGTIQSQETPDEEEPLQTKRENNTGMPDNLKAGVESLSGIDMGDVRIHYNSSKPAQVGALAYTKGKDIHVASGQERHLSHEAWHVVQQMQGRVKPTLQAKGVAINDDAALEREADLMGAKAVTKESLASFSALRPADAEGELIQRNATPATSGIMPPIQRRGEYHLLKELERDEIDTLSEVDYHNSAEVFETRLGRLASVHPRALAVADELATRALALVLQHLGAEATLTQLSTIFGTDKRGNTGSVGQGEDAIRAVFEDGNFREKMTLVYNAYANRQLAPIISDAIAHKTGLNLNQLFNRPEELMRDRVDRRESLEGKRQTTLPPDEVQYPPLSERERAFAVEEEHLLWEPGMKLFYFDLMSNYAKEARQLRALYGGGRSGTTYIIIKAAAMLGVSDLYDARLACLGWMIPAGDHTFYEIMVAAREFGLEYVDGPLGYRVVTPIPEDILRGLSPDGRFPDEYLDEDYKDDLARRRFPSPPTQMKSTNTSNVVQAKLFYHGRPDTLERTKKNVTRSI